MGRLSSNVSSAVELLLCQGQEPDQPIFDTLPPSVYSQSCADTTHNITEPLKLKDISMRDT